MAHDPRYPIGRFTPPSSATAEERAAWIGELAILPGHLRSAVEGLDDAALATPYREGGWTVRQVVHHLADSHLNAYVRFKLALTEERPTIRPYDEAAWARLADGGAPVGDSLDLLDALHRRWVALLEAMTDGEFARVYLHPEQGRSVSLGEALALYAWHGRHHLAHVRGATGGGEPSR
jgi:uncharacterized damage-inducible protein DinB